MFCRFDALGFIVLDLLAQAQDVRRRAAQRTYSEFQNHFPFKTPELNPVSSAGSTLRASSLNPDSPLLVSVVVEFK
jgi:hypothetical protein